MPSTEAVVYRTRVGTVRKESPVGTPALERLPYREAEDDGRTLLHMGSLLPRCADCELGTLRSVTFGPDYTRAHRICDHCGSHWELHPLVYFMRRENERRIEIDLGWFKGGLLEPDREQRIRGDGSPTHGDVLALLRVHHVADAVEHACGGLAHVDACWARRARFAARSYAVAAGGIGPVDRFALPHFPEHSVDPSKHP